MTGKKLSALILASILTSCTVFGAYAAETEEEQLPVTGNPSDLLEISITNDTGGPIYGLTALDEAQTERHEFETDSDQLIGDGETYILRCVPEDISLVFYTGTGDEYMLYTFPAEDMTEAVLCIRNETAYLRYPSISKNITINTRLKETTLREDLAAAEAVTGQIAAVGSVTGDKQTAVQAAREAYNALNDRQKEYVTNLALLEEMESGTQAQDGGETAQTEGNDGYEVFKDLDGREFGFSSGAGGWSSELIVYADGSFEGSFFDSYPTSGMAADGTYYLGTIDISEFSGKFSVPEKVNDYTYSTYVESLSYEHPVGSGEVIDEVLYSNVEAYGISEGDVFLIYLPTKPLSELPEEYLIGHSAAFTDDTYTGRYILDNDSAAGFFIQYIDT